MSRIPIDLPPDSYPKMRRGSSRGSKMLSLLLFFAAIFVLSYMALEFL